MREKRFLCSTLVYHPLISSGNSEQRQAAKAKNTFLETAKTDSAEALGTVNIILPASLKILTPSKETVKKEYEDSMVSYKYEPEYSQLKGKHC